MGPAQRGEAQSRPLIIFISVLLQEFAKRRLMEQMGVSECTVLPQY